LLVSNKQSQRACASALGKEEGWLSTVRVRPTRHRPKFTESLRKGKSSQ
jgi:hypothetical protein